MRNINMTRGPYCDGLIRTPSGGQVSCGQEVAPGEGKYFQCDDCRAIARTGRSPLLDAAAQVMAEPPRPKITGGSVVEPDWVARFDQTIRRHEEFMNGWLARFEALLSRGIR